MFVLGRHNMKVPLVLISLKRERAGGTFILKESFVIGGC